MLRWKDNIATAVFECARMGMVPDTPIPVDPNIMNALPKHLKAKVRIETI